MKKTSLLIAALLFSTIIVRAQIDCRTLPTWSSSAQYNWNDKIQFNGNSYQATQWNQNATPNSSANIWTPLGACYDPSYFSSIDTINIYKNGNVIFKKEVTVIDSITFQNNTNNVLNVYRKNIVVFSYDMSPTDSISFKKTNAKPSMILGDDYQGGKIAYFFKPGDLGYVIGEVHGIIAAPNDMEWYAEKILDWSVQGTVMPDSIPTSLEIGTGALNTQKIIDTQGGGVPGWPYSAMICRQVPTNGFGDWFIPSLNELKAILVNHQLIGDINTTRTYSSSSHHHTDYHWQASIYGVKVDCSWNGALIRQVRTF
jgi:hypothetical protein